MFLHSACSHRLQGLPSSSGSPSLLHLRALAPQRRVVSSWQGTVEPQPPPRACSVVAWPIARQGFCSGQPTIYPGLDLSRWSESLPSSQRDSPHTTNALTHGKSFLEHKQDDRSYAPPTTKELTTPPFLRADSANPYHNRDGKIRILFWTRWKIWEDG